MSSPEKNFKQLFFKLFFLALIIRLFFVFWGADYFYPASKFINNDSGSYSRSFLNLLQSGHYTHDPRVADASFGRLPGYPFFWGLHYLVFGPEKVYLAVSISQSILDSLSALLVFLLAFHLTKNKKRALFAGSLYVFYPFSIVWVTITGTESLATFLSLLLVYLVIVRKNNWGNLIITGIVLAMAFYTREYLGIFLPFTGIYFLFKYGFHSGMKKAIVLGVVFLLLYLPWPIRNYVNHNRVVFIKPPSAGYIEYTSDINAFRSWLFAWQPSDWQPYFDQIVYGIGSVNFPSWVFANKEEKELAAHLIDLSRKCGTGFHAWRTYQILIGENCNQEIQEGFLSLKKSFIKHKPMVYYFTAPAKNVFKCFFNLRVDSQEDRPSLIKAGFLGLFIYRGILFFIAIFAGIVLTRRNIDSFLLIAFPLFFIFFISFVTRQVEMRYLLQAEALVFPFLGYFPLIFSKSLKFFH